MFDSIFVPATKGPAQTLRCPVCPDRKLRLGRHLSPRCIPSHPALSFPMSGTQIMSAAEDLTLAFALLDGFVVEAGKARRTKYIKPNSRDEVEARKALARLLRSNDPLDRHLRRQL